MQSALRGSCLNFRFLTLRYDPAAESNPWSTLPKVVVLTTLPPVRLLSNDIVNAHFESNYKTRIPFFESIIVAILVNVLMNMVLWYYLMEDTETTHWVHWLHYLNCYCYWIQHHTDLLLYHTWCALVNLCRFLISNLCEFKYAHQ